MRTFLLFSSPHIKNQLSRVNMYVIDFKIVISGILNKRKIFDIFLYKYLDFLFFFFEMSTM
jgi:hypothetical protein